MGLRAYPWLQDARREQHRDAPTQPMFLHCATCREHNAEPLRRAMGCGWMHVDLEIDEVTGRTLPQPSAWKHPEDPDDQPEVCAGYTTALPEVIDIVENYPHHEKGNLALLFPEGTSRAFMDGMSMLDRSISQCMNRPPEPK